MENSASHHSHFKVNTLLLHGVRLYKLKLDPSFICLPSWGLFIYTSYVYWKTMETLCCEWGV